MTQFTSPCTEERRQELLQQALSGAHGARDVKLVLRVGELANDATVEWVDIAQRSSSRVSSARTWLAGACASVALVAVFSVNQSNVTTLPRTTQPQELASNLPDHFGASGSFEGAGASSDNFGRLNFEAN
jgi:hypothetical protein